MHVGIVGLDRPRYPNNARCLGFSRIVLDCILIIDLYPNNVLSSCLSKTKRVVFDSLAPVGVLVYFRIYVYMHQ